MTVAHAGKQIKRNMKNLKKSMKMANISFA
jgi:hypothetical protein